MKIFYFLLMTAVFATAEKIPFELERLNNQRDRKIEEINQIYKKQLESLKVKYTKAGNLDAANQVAAILKELGPTKEKETRWEWGSGGELVLRPNGVATHTIWKRNGKWSRQEDGSIRLESDLGKIFIIQIEGSMGHVTKFSDGKRTTIKQKK
ncbi:hypothetical protein N8651_04030 [Akkermansiaceae bacterium]|nr:hypothetical protein [Akkermansiaceae bacterium]